MNLDEAETFLKFKGLDTVDYCIQDVSNNYKAQIPIAIWLTEFAEKQVNGDSTKSDKCTLHSVMGRYSYELLKFEELPWQLRQKIIDNIEKQLDEDFIKMGFDFKPTEIQYRDRVEYVTVKTTYFKEGGNYFCAELKDLGFYNAP